MLCEAAVSDEAMQSPAKHKDHICEKTGNESLGSHLDSCLVKPLVVANSLEDIVAEICHAHKLQPISQSHNHHASLEVHESQLCVAYPHDGRGTEKPFEVGVRKLVNDDTG